MIVEMDRGGFTAVDAITPTVRLWAQWTGCLDLDLSSNARYFVVRGCDFQVPWPFILVPYSAFRFFGVGSSAFLVCIFDILQLSFVLVPCSASLRFFGVIFLVLWFLDLHFRHSTPLLCFGSLLSVLSVL